MKPGRKFYLTTLHISTICSIMQWGASRTFIENMFTEMREGIKKESTQERMGMEIGFPPIINLQESNSDRIRAWTIDFFEIEGTSRMRTIAKKSYNKIHALCQHHFTTNRVSKPS